MSERLTVVTTCVLPDETVLIAAHYLRADEDLGAIIRERMDMPGAKSVTVTRESKENIVAHLESLCDAESVLPESGGVN